MLPIEANSSIRGPNGILIYKNRLFVANQNLGEPSRGAVLAFDVPATARTGELAAQDLPFSRADTDPVPHYEPNAPLGPRGIAIGGPQPLLYIADAAGAILAFEADPPYSFIGEHLRPLEVASISSACAADSGNLQNNAEIVLKLCILLAVHHWIGSS